MSFNVGSHDRTRFTNAETTLPTRHGRHHSLACSVLLHQYRCTSHVHDTVTQDTTGVNQLLEAGFLLGVVEQEMEEPPVSRLYTLHLYTSIAWSSMMSSHPEVPTGELTLLHPLSDKISSTNINIMHTIVSDRAHKFQHQVKNICNSVQYRVFKVAQKLVIQKFESSKYSDSLSHTLLDRIS